jgi:DNA repair exonuclease SbcCD nuclease subunit
MKLAIVSDLHIGCDRFAEDALAQAEEALEKASEQSDAILIAGDIFDKRSPKPEVIADAIELFRPLADKQWPARVASFTSRSNKVYTKLPIIAISGTHERTAEGRDNPLSLLGLAGFLIDTSEATTMIEKNGERVAIFGLGGLSEDHVREKLKELQPKPVSGAFNIFMFHQSVYELLPFSEGFIRYSELPKGFDLYLCGHIHNRIEASVHGKKLLIPGSTVLTQFKDAEQERKGFIIFDTSTYSYKFEYINSRRFIVKELHFDDATPTAVRESCEAAIEQLLGSEKDKPIIKLNLKGTIGAGFAGADLSLHAITAKYAGKAVLSIDSSKLTSPEIDGSIEAIRDGKFGGMSVKERGMSILFEKLKEHKFEGADAQKLFEMLSDASNKEKVLKSMLEFLSAQQQ